MNGSKQYEVLQWAFSFLRKHAREEKVAEILLKHHLNLSRAAFYASMQEEVSPSIIKQFKKDIEQHALTGIPVQHLTGYEFFYGRKFSVNKHVLIPRFETEELVQHVITKVKNHLDGQSIAIIDVGTGSGVIAITLALELPDVTVYATDISTEALSVAKKNAKEHKASVQFLQGDFLQPIIDLQINPSVIVSNPPYIDMETEGDSLSDTVKNFDPEEALFAGKHGLEAYEKITSQIKDVPKEKQLVFFEIGHSQAEDVTAIVKQQFPSFNIETIQDINGKDRIISASNL